MDAKKAPSENTINVMDTFETWMALKEKINVKAISNPTNINFQ
jgi:hypothetical protein